MVHFCGTNSIGRQIYPVGVSTGQSVCETSNIQSSALGSSLHSDMARICGNWGEMLHQVNNKPRLLLVVPTSRHIISHPEHIWHNNYEYKVIEVKLEGIPFRRLGNRSAAIICPHAHSRHGIISFRFVVWMGAGIDDGLVGSGGRARESGIDRIQSVNAPYVGEEAHRGDI